MSEAPKVLFVIDTLEVGGAEQSLLGLLPRLRGVRPVLCHLYPGDALRADFEAVGVEVHALELAGKYRFAAAISGLRTLIRRLQPDIVHATLFRSSIAARVAARLEGRPLVDSFVSESYALARRARMGPAQRFRHGCLRWLDRCTVPLVSRFVANSNAIRVANCRALGISPDRIEVIYRGRDPQLFSREAAGREGLRESLFPELPDNALLVICVARLYPNKGIAELVEAFSRVAPDLDFVRLLIVGDGPCRAALQAQMSSLGLSTKVQLTGTRSDIPKLLSAADLFVSASHYEGLPGAVVEAMLCGLPLLLTDLDVHREMLGELEQGLLFPIGDVAALAEQLRAYAVDHRQYGELGAQLRQRACELFDIDAVARRYEVCYQRVLGLYPE